MCHGSYEYTITSKPMEHARGMWAGMRPNWYTATHKATGFSVTWHEWGDGVLPHKQRGVALACLEMMIDEMKPRNLPPDPLPDTPA